MTSDVDPSDKTADAPNAQERWAKKRGVPKGCGEFVRARRRTGLMWGPPHLRRILLEHYPNARDRSSRSRVRMKMLYSFDVEQLDPI